MTKSELVAQLALRFPQLVLKDADFAVKTMLDAMSDALANGHRIEIRGFGSFGLNRRPSRVGRNPKSGDKVLVPEKFVPHFKPGKELRERVDRRAGEPLKPGQWGDCGWSGVASLRMSCCILLQRIAPAGVFFYVRIGSGLVTAAVKP